MKKLFKKKYLKIFVWLMLTLILVLIWKSIYDYYKYEINVTKEELEKRKIDEYNFEQLEKVKDILWKLKKTAHLESLETFNKTHNLNIKPIKNCYYISQYNWDSKYIFWFELYSKKYRDKYGEEDRHWIFYYAYPKYDLPAHKVCFWSKESCSDLTYDYFLKRITNPCND